MFAELLFVPSAQTLCSSLAHTPRRPQEMRIYFLFGKHQTFKHQQININKVNNHLEWLRKKKINKIILVNVRPVCSRDMHKCARVKSMNRLVWYWWCCNHTRTCTAVRRSNNRRGCQAISCLRIHFQLHRRNVMGNHKIDYTHINVESNGCGWKDFIFHLDWMW